MRQQYKPLTIRKILHQPINHIKANAPKPINKRQNHKYHSHASCNPIFSALHNITLHKTAPTTHKIITEIHLTRTVKAGVPSMVPVSSWPISRVPPAIDDDTIKSPIFIVQ